MNLKQLEAFVHVAEGGSFSRAAKELYLTQPTISAHISSLEKELSVRLFVRNTKEVNLSGEGKDLYRYARQMIDLQTQIEEKFHVAPEEENHCITIAASTIPSQYLLPKILSRYSEKYPKEQFKITQTDSARVVTEVVDHMVEIGLTGTVLEKKNCKYIPFYKDRLTIITPNTKKYKKLEKEADISWILSENVIMREEGSGTRKEAEKQLKMVGIDPSKLNIVASIDNPETIKKSVSRGMGISILSSLATQEEAAAGQILTFSIPGSDFTRDIHVAYNRNYKLSRSAQRFIRVIREVYDVE